MNDNKKYYILFSAILISIATTCISSCQSKLTKDELIEYVKNPDNGLIHKKTINNVEFKVNYKPTGLLVSQEVSSSKTFEELELQYSKYLYFNLSVSQNNSEILSNKPFAGGEFSTTLFELLNNMSQHVHLLNDKHDTLMMVDYVYPRVYGHSDATNMLFVFDKDDYENSEYLKLCINEFGLNTGNTKYKFLIKDIRNAPGLKI